jgi:2-dehydropantoate 2-reductase
MRICVFGAGAVGGHLAAKLAAAGNQVSVVARGPNLRAVQRNGLKLIHGGQVIRGDVRASERAVDLGPQDLVIVTLKACALSAAAGEIAGLLGPDTAVAFAQNGVPWWYASGLGAARPKPPDLSRLDPGGRLAGAIAPARVIGAVIYSANDLIEPGVVENHTPGNNMLVVGECDDRGSERIGAFRSVLERSDVSSPHTADIREAVWNKLLLNLGTSTLCLLAGRSVGDMRADPQLAALEKRIREEGRAVARAHGVDPEKAPKRPSGSHASGGISHKPSILQDYEAGRPMEVEAQLAAPLVFARAAGVATPTLDALIPIAVHKAASKGLYTT